VCSAVNIWHRSTQSRFQIAESHCHVAFIIIKRFDRYVLTHVFLLPQNKVATVFREIKSITFQGLSSTLTAFSKPTPLQFSACDSFYGIKSVILMFTIVLTTAPFFYIMGNTDYFGIQSLSRTSYAKFQSFQAPNPFSRTFHGPKE